MHLKRTLPWWTSFLEAQLSLVWKSLSQFHISNLQLNTEQLFPRIWEISKDDLAGLHLKPWRTLWTLSWNQFHFCYRTFILVHHQAFQGSFGPSSLILKINKARLLLVWFLDPLAAGCGLGNLARLLFTQICQNLALKPCKDSICKISYMNSK